MSDFYQLSPEKQAERMQTLATQALKSWNIKEARLQLIKMRENAVFRVDTQDARRYALRIHRHGYHSDDELRSELQWMQALDRDGIDVPPIEATKDGALFAVIESSAVPEPRQVDLFGWIEGEQLGSVEGSLEGDLQTLVRTHCTIGELAARLHNQACNWQLPENFKRHAWDAEGIVGDQPLWGRFWDLEVLSNDERELLTRARDGLREDLSNLSQKRESFGLIHADFAPENLMVHNDRIRLIDFDDSGFGWHLFEIVTSLYFHTGEDYF